jgi:2-polyprenyl-3-methyl-5-hydroxy-6-metoxy-1,4-benzoquinol methylase
VPCHAIAATETEGPVEVSGEFDVIIMSEFLEHVRSPRLFLVYALSHLKKGGILYDSLGSVHKHSVGGDHLREAKSEMENTNYQEFFIQNLVPVNDYLNVEAYDHFYMKR